MAGPEGSKRPRTGPEGVGGDQWDSPATGVDNVEKGVVEKDVLSGATGRDT